MTMQSAFPWNDPEKPQTTLKEYIDRYNKEGQGIKYDQGKLQWDLMPFDLLEDELRVWMFGAKKYAAHNWRKGIPMTQAYNALMRHLVAYMIGEDKDPESSYSHLAHAACCLKMMQHAEKYRPDLDDRYWVTKE